MTDDLQHQPAAAIAGVDEVGRGPLAGPVVAAAVILDPACLPAGIRDSKQLTERARSELAPRIKTQCVAWSIAAASVEEIDNLNIRQATHLAMRRAVAALEKIPDLVLVDGNDAPEFEHGGKTLQAKTLVGGDSRSQAIGAASIIAKVARDTDMILLDSRYPGYQFARNKGYGTRAHRESLQALGPTPAHRRSFAPLRHWVAEGRFE